MSIQAGPSIRKFQEIGCGEPASAAALIVVDNCGEGGVFGKASQG
jgi:hypothetical protein